MSCIVLDVELADIHVIKELGVFIHGKVPRYSVRPLKMYKPTKQAFWLVRNLHRILRNSGLLDYIELAEYLHRPVKDKYFAKRSEKCKILGNLMDEELEILEHLGCPKVQHLAETDEEMWYCSNYPLRHKTTLHCTERKAKLFGNWPMPHLNLYSLYSEMYCQYLRILIFQNYSIFCSIFIVEKLTLQD